MSFRYSSFEQVEGDTKRGVFRNESELRQAFIEALKEELARSTCNRYLVEVWLMPSLDETLRRGRPDIRISNLVIEVESPLSDLDKGREQLFRYMEELYESTARKVNVYGVVMNGERAELWVRDYAGSKLILSSTLANVLRSTIAQFCSQKIPVISVEDLVRLFGV